MMESRFTNPFRLIEVVRVWRLGFHNCFHTASDDDVAAVFPT